MSNTISLDFSQTVDEVFSRNWSNSYVWMCQGSHLLNGLGGRGVKTQWRTSGSEGEHNKWPCHSWSKVPGSFSLPGDWAMTCFMLTSNLSTVRAPSLNGPLDRVWTDGVWGCFSIRTVRLQLKSKRIIVIVWDQGLKCLNFEYWNVVVHLAWVVPWNSEDTFSFLPMQDCKFHKDRGFICFSCCSTSFLRNVSGT